jgi:predicted nuclease with RNAse H fold
MKNTLKTKSFSIGWDVGGWNCDKNGKSRDAIVVLDSALHLVGEPWRGNLRESIRVSATTQDWLAALFGRCEAVAPVPGDSVTMAIDTPLGFPEEFIGLVTRQVCVEADETSGRNRYLFRQTERRLFAQGLAPLSAVKDMIGSQATKGMHVVAKFAPQIESCGVWTDGAGFRAIETYPTACKKAAVVKTLLQGQTSLGHEDKDDARVCAVIAHLFATDPSALERPDGNVSCREGWIWAPRQPT